MEKKRIKLTIDQCKARVEEMLSKGQTTVIIRDNDNESWCSGWADFLLDNYNYSNLTTSCRINLSQPKHAKKVFIICTIRDASKEYLDKLDSYVSDLENEGIKVFAPHRDTNQQAIGYKICKQNMGAIIDADEIHIFYNSKSQGTHFDMGMAFALNKKIIVVESEPLTKGKSFQNMLVEWVEFQGI